MKITINKQERMGLEAGDFLLVGDSGCDKALRQIIRYNQKYIAVDMEHGDIGLENKSLIGLFEDYENTYESVEIIKNSEVELIVGGR